MRRPSLDRPCLVPPAAVMAVVLVALVGGGCRRSGPERFRASGAVTFAGQPVSLGRIVFEPDASRGNSGPQGFAPIENGRYDTSAPHCKGSVGGPMVVRIDGMEVTGGEDVAASGRLLFPTHEQRIELPKSDTTRDFDVPKAGTR